MLIFMIQMINDIDTNQNKSQFILALTNLILDSLLVTITNITSIESCTLLSTPPSPPHFQPCPVHNELMHLSNASFSLYI